ncbi:non-homologous end joining protein Ku [Aeromicrobium choanae]|uniref:Non-homologous end joining protein Ku n=1 Tax=Aeromicrobium choanae TaxID=1736691 RepID=A0A1T4YZG5_9ACTN|nr:Ku protein [Aeromicrobium choanae]SKB06645.1 DNA end-binding protein Ku [Aeromicrobium choanae]
MRAIWKGAISFGLVHVPVKVYSATESHDVSLHQVHDEDGGRIRYERRCEICKEVVPYKNIDKAYDDGERTIVLTDEDLKSLPAERSHEIDVVEFVPDDQIDVLRLGNPYFLEPEEKALKPYSLLRQALEETERTAVVTFALRQRTRLGALRVRDNVLVLQTLLWDDEVRTADFPVLENTAKVTQKELAMAGQLIESLAGDFDASQFTDDYQEQLKTLIEAKQKAGEGIDTEATFGPQEDEGGEVVDLMEALRRSVEARKGDAAADQPKKKAAKKKSSA